jgi:hypothetical protein
MSGDLSVSIDRTSLGLGPLVIHSTEDDGPLVFTEDGYAEPAFETVVTFAPDSAWVNGSLPLSSRVGEGTWTLAIYVLASSIADFDTKAAELTTALGRLSFPVSRTLKGQVKSWTATASSPTWDPITYALADALAFRAVLQIPVNQ